MRVLLIVVGRIGSIGRDTAVAPASVSCNRM